MSEIEDGGRAFPWCGDLNETPSINLGLTVRDYMAAKAMQGMCANGDAIHRGDEVIAKDAYAIADAMIRARSQP